MTAISTNDCLLVKYRLMWNDSIGSRVKQRSIVKQLKKSSSKWISQQQQRINELIATHQRLNRRL
jgi:hypothetical protein